MKNIYKLKVIRRITGIIALVAVIGFSFAACGGDGSPSNGLPDDPPPDTNPVDEPDPREDFYGIWTDISSPAWKTELRINKLENSGGGTGGYTIENLTWETITSTSGLMGYKITGTLTDNTGSYHLPTPGGGYTDVVGDTVFDVWYISADKLELYWCDWSDPTQAEEADPYQK